MILRVATKDRKSRGPLTMKLMPEDHKVIAQIRERFGLQGLPTPQVVRVALRRLLEEAQVA
jgi:hypothetical protein